MCQAIINRIKTTVLPSGRLKEGRCRRDKKPHWHFGTTEEKTRGTNEREEKKKIKKKKNS